MLTMMQEQQCQRSVTGQVSNVQALRWLEPNWRPWPQQTAVMPQNVLLPLDTHLMWAFVTTDSRVQQAEAC
jgi:hypothetical protein